MLDFVQFHKMQALGTPSFFFVASKEDAQPPGLVGSIIEHSFRFLQFGGNSFWNSMTFWSRVCFFSPLHSCQLHLKRDCSEYTKTWRWHYSVNKTTASAGYTLKVPDCLAEWKQSSKALSRLTKRTDRLSSVFNQMSEVTDLLFSHLPGTCGELEQV